MTTNLLNDLTATGIRAFVQDERDAARKEATESGYKVIRSRGTFLCTADHRGDQCRPSEEAGCPKWKGTISEIHKLLYMIAKDYPNVAEVYISGGYDGGDSLRDIWDGDYEPWISAWHLTIWKREGQA